MGQASVFKYAKLAATFGKTNRHWITPLVSMKRGVLKAKNEPCMARMVAGHPVGPAPAVWFCTHSLVPLVVSVKLRPSVGSTLWV